MNSDVIESNEYFEARRGFLVQLYGKVRIATFIVAPVLVAMYVILVIRYPCWQTKVLLGLSLGLAGCFGLAAWVASRGRLELSALLIVGSTTVELFGALLLRVGAAASTSIALVALMAYIALFSRRSLKWSAITGGVVLFSGALISYSEVIPRFDSGPRAQLLSELVFIVVFVWAISFLLRQGQVISALLFEEMRRTGSRQSQVLETIEAIAPRLRETIVGIQRTSDAVAAQASEQAQTSSSTTHATAELASMVGTTVAAVEDARSIAVQTREASLASRDKLIAVEGAFNNVVRRIEVVQERVEDLATKISSTAEVNRAIREIAENLKMLSVNASIESARSGEHGRGFAVIAEELRRMIAQTSSDLQNSSSLLEAIRRDAVAISEETGTSTAELRSCFGELRSTGALVQQITDSFLLTSSKVDEIAGAARSQQDRITEISATMRQFDAAAGQLTVAAETLTGGVDQIGRVDGALRDILATNVADTLLKTGSPVGGSSPAEGSRAAASQER